MKGFRRRLWVVGILVGILLPVSGYASDRADQRKLFLDAHKAVKQGAITRYRKLSGKLTDYPLYGYLEYEYLRRRLNKLPREQVRHFLKTYDGQPIARRLRINWLNKLARKGQWKDYLMDYRDLGITKLDCHRARAMQKTKHPETEYAIQALWQTGKSQPRACDPVFNSWRASGKATPTLIWQRIRLAMHNRKPNLARYLAKSLGPEDRMWVERWRLMYRRPAKMLGHKNYRDDTPLVREIVLHGIERLARIDSGEADKKWQKLRHRYSFSEEDTATTLRTIALHAATQRSKDALTLLDTIPVSHRDEKIHAWTIRSALAAQDWHAVTRAIDNLPADMKLESDWRYWKARAQEKTGNTTTALKTYTALANEHNYHGFLAADRLSLPYVLDGTPISRDSKELVAFSKIPAMDRAHELYLLGMIIDARREWHAAMATFSPRQLELAAVLASSWGWHDRAIISAGRARHYSDLQLRYPIAFEKQVLQNARRNSIDPAWVFSIMRQESAYMTDARSHAGALGLMQLMPRTAKFEARRLKLRLRNQREILNVDKNIRLGTAHLKRVLETHNGNLPLATAAYNAGSFRVRSWLPSDGSLPADIWIENVPFKETRNYVKKILATTAIFEKHLSQPVTPLKLRMPEISPKS